MAGGYQSGSEGSESSDSEYGTDVETDDESDDGDAARRATRARTLKRPAAAATPAAPAAKRAPARQVTPAAPATPPPEGHYRARFVTAADLAEGASPVVLGFGQDGFTVMQRTSPEGSAVDRWEVCVDIPLGKASVFNLGTTQPDGRRPEREAGPQRTLRARSRTAEVAVRCVWGDGAEDVRVQVAYAHVTFSVPAAAPKFGASLAVVGSPAALGAWAPSAALPLAWAGGDGVESAWRSAAVPLPVAEALTWRLAERGADGLLRPEPGPERTLALRRGGGGVVTATWGEHAPPGAPPGEPMSDLPPPKTRAPRVPKAAKPEAATPKPAAAPKKSTKADDVPADVAPAPAAAAKKADKKADAPAKAVKPAKAAAEKAAEAAPAAAPAAEAVRARRPRDGASSLEAALLDPLVPMLQAALPSLAEGMTWTRDAAVAGALAPPDSEADSAPRRGLLRVDLAVMLPRLALLFECDEDAHRATRSRYAPEKEEARMQALAVALAADTPPRSASFVRIAAPRTLGGDGAGAVWAESAPLAVLRARAVAAAAAMAEARPTRNAYRVAYVGFEDDDFIQEMPLPKAEAAAAVDGGAAEAGAPAKKKAPAHKVPPTEPGVVAPKALPKKVRKL